MIVAEDIRNQLSSLSERLTEIAGDIKVHKERDTAMAERFKKMEDNFEKFEIRLEKMDHQVSNIDDMANKWKGGVVVLMGVGGLLGTALAFWDKLNVWLHR